MATNKPILPIFRAQRYHSEIIEGGYFTAINTGQSYIVGNNAAPHCVRPETVEISIDNGENWYSMERLNELMEKGHEYEYAIECLMPKPNGSENNE